MYLRRFADGKTQVLLVRRDDPTERQLSSVARACRETGYYVIPTDDLEDHAREGHEPEMAEQTLSDIEGTANLRIDELLHEGCPPSDEVRFTLSLFFAIQITRGASFRRTMNEIGEALAPSWLAAQFPDDEIRRRLKERGKSASDSEVGELYEFVTGPNGPNPQWRQGNYVQEALRHALQLQRYLFFRTWRLLRFEQPCLITSDEPVAVLAGDGPLPMGPANSSAIWVPLDRQHSLAMTLTGTEGVVTTGKARARRINQMVADQAERWVICHPDDREWVPTTLGPSLEWRDEVLAAYRDGNHVREQHVLVPRPVSE
jgi:hypothetical protein